MQWLGNHGCGRGPFPMDGSVFAFAVWGYLVGILLLVAAPSIHPSQVRAKCARINAELRNVALALEAWRDEHGRYPPGRIHAGEIADASVLFPDHLDGLPLEVAFATDRVRLSRPWSLTPWAAVAIAVAASALLLAWRWRELEPRAGRARLLLLMLIALPCVHLSAVPGNREILPLMALPLLTGSCGVLLWILLRWRGGDAKDHGDDHSRGHWVIGAVLPFCLALSVAFAGGGELLIRIAVESEELSATYCYYTDGRREFVLQAAGPDGVYDWPPDGFPISMEALERSRYDPTNGLISGGDLLRPGGYHTREDRGDILPDP